ASVEALVKCEEAAERAGNLRAGSTVEHTHVRTAAGSGSGDDVRNAIAGHITERHSHTTAEARVKCEEASTRARKLSASRGIEDTDVRATALSRADDDEAPRDDGQAGDRCRAFTNGPDQRGRSRSQIDAIESREPPDGERRIRGAAGVDVEPGVAEGIERHAERPNDCDLAAVCPARATPVETALEDKRARSPRDAIERRVDSGGDGAIPVAVVGLADDLESTRIQVRVVARE